MDAAEVGVVGDEERATGAQSCRGVQGVGYRQARLGAQSGSILEHLMRCVQQPHRTGREQLTVLHFNRCVAVPEWLHERFHNEDGAARDGEVAVLCFLPHRFQKCAVRLHSLHAVDETAGIEVDQARGRKI